MGVCALLACARVGTAESGDPQAGGRRLRQLAAAGQLAPLPDTGSGITRDVGSIAVIEHDGSNYDKLEPDGTPNFQARGPVAQRFYQTHGDYYDFLVVFTNFEFETGNAQAFHNLVRNSELGTGTPILDNGALFGSPGRLKGYVDMAAVSRYRALPYGVEPSQPGFRTSLNVLAHEIGHQWLARVKYRDGGGQDSSALTTPGAHWSYLLDSDASVLYGSDWVTTGGGVYTAARVDDGYSSLDRYLMGLLDAAKVPPLTLLRNPAVDPSQPSVEGATVAATPETVTLGQVMAAEGPRVPDHRLSQKEFRLGFLFLTQPGTQPSHEDLDAVERLRQAFAGHFFTLTSGVAIADTTLAEGPTMPPAPAPDLDKALAWLLAQQSVDGRWEDAPATAMRDTATVLEALLQTGETTAPYQRGQAWIQTAGFANLDFATRRARALAPALATAGDRTALARWLLAQQNPDGGFGAGPGYASDAFDTGLALRALAALQQPADAKVERAVAALAVLRSPSGGWPVVSGGPPSTLVTAHVLLGLQDWRSLPAARDLATAETAKFTARRNPDGGFGESPSTPYATALGLQVLLSGSAPQGAIDEATAWLQARQATDGSWEGSRYQTALVVAALRGGLAPNLIVPQDGLVLDPSPAREGDVVRVTARIRNSGRTPAAATIARLFDGDPAAAPALAEAGVPALDPGVEVVVAFDYPTTDRAGTRTLFVVADPDGAVSEAREDDNAASRPLQVEGPLADLAIFGTDVAVTPDPPEEGETVAVAITVRNRGDRASAPSLLRLSNGSPRAGGVLVGQATIPSLAIGGALALQIPWNTSGLTGGQTLFAVADAAFSLSESDETNNEASYPVTVVGQAAPGPDLEVSLVEVDPAALHTVPQPAVIRARVRNLGRDAASSKVVVYDGDPTAGLVLGQQAVTLGGRASTALSLDVTLTTGGDRSVFAVVDPSNGVAETDETNNQASALVHDPQNTVDLEVLAAETTVSSSDVVVGTPLTVTATVRNRGTAPVTDLPVILAHSDSGLAELTRVLVTLAPGASTVVELPWTTSFTGDPVPLAVVADPFGLLTELSEDNNRVDLSVRVRPSTLPNLAVSGADIQFQPDPPVEGASAGVSVVVRNPSTVPAGPFVVRFHRGNPDEGGSVIAEAALGGLGAGGTTTAQVTWTPVDVRGAQGVFAVVDALGQVEEYDETDNRGFRAFSAIGLPDIVLTTADVRLSPPYPRVGEAVTIEATVRNLGGQPAAAEVVRAYEGEPGSGTLIGEGPVPLLAPGQAATVSLSWTPVAPPGDRVLSLIADAEGVVPEQDEGNNLARRTVVAQDADLYLTEPHFSPDGDGVKDETTLAYRTADAVRIVVSDSRGQLVRVLAEDAPASGSVTWDGRDDFNRLTGDGTYTLTTEGEGNVVLGRVEAVVDTNRGTLHDVAGTGLTATRNLTCSLPDSVVQFAQPVWTAAEDAVLYVVPQASQDFPIGLLRVPLGGSAEYVVQDPWFAGANLLSVAPDGSDLLLANSSGLHLVNLTTGGHRLLVAGQSFGSWSPDGGKLVVGDEILSRDGAVIGTLPDDAGVSVARPKWEWSPDGQWLARGNAFVRPDGSGVQTVDIPASMDPCDGNWESLSNRWLPDLRLVMGLGCGDGDFNETVVIDRATGTVSALTVPLGVWSPDGGKVLYSELRPDGSSHAVVAGSDGSNPRELAPFALSASPRGTAGTFGDLRPVPPSSSCRGDRTFDTFALTSLQNLTVDVGAASLPGEGGLLVKGTVVDQNLDNFQLEYATGSAPDAWHPLGPVSDVPVVDDFLAVWAPASPGSYLLRLRAEDRAGNRRARTQLVYWDRTPILANLVQSEYLISPNGDGTKDGVRVSYLVQAPTRVEVRVAGPEASPDTATPPTVRRFSLDHPLVGAAFFDWDGRDEQGQVVPDGRYTVFVNELPLRVDVDTTPPDIAYALSDLRSQTTLAYTCRLQRPVEVGTLTANLAWHAVDSSLKKHTLGTTPVYEPARDASGQVLYDRGIPRVLRRDGRAVDVRIAGAALQGVPPAVFEAEDYAGNRSVVNIPPLEERLFALEGRPDGCEGVRNGLQRMLPPIDSDVQLFRPATTFVVGETLRSAESHDVRLQHRADAQGIWTDGPTFPIRGMGEWAADLPSLGLSPRDVYRGRFRVQRTGGEVDSEEFRFRICDEFFELISNGGEPISGTNNARYQLVLSTAVAEDLTGATLTVRGESFSQTVSMNRTSPSQFSASVVAPAVDCNRRQELSFSAKVTGRSGRVYDRSDGVCRRLSLVLPRCECAIAIEQQFGSCAVSSPNSVRLAIGASSSADDATVVLERGPVGAPIVIDQYPVGGREIVLDVTGQPAGTFEVRGRVMPAGGGLACASTRMDAVIDRTPPGVVFREPVEGGSLCLSQDTASGKELARLVVQVSDTEPAELTGLEYRTAGAGWLPFQRFCRGPECSPAADRIAPGQPVEIYWDVTRLAAGPYTVRLSFCDKFGNTTSVERPLSFSREPPYVGLISQDRKTFSPNGDGRGDLAAATFRTVESLTLSAEVRAGGVGGLVVRTLVPGQTFGPGPHEFTWDGRNAAGQPVADGLYVLSVTATNGCGGRGQAFASLTVDTAPPVAVLSRPTPGQAVQTTVDVEGRASDEQFAGYELSYGSGGAPATWLPVSVGTAPVDPAGLLGRWNPPGAEGPYTLRLTVTDAADNLNEARVTVNVAPRTYLDRFGATPTVFSPNDDGRLDSATVEYVLLTGGRVTLEVRDAQDQRLRRLENAADHAAGTYVVAWDGKTDAGLPAPEGNLRVWIRVEDPAGATAAQESAIGLGLDRMPPVVVVEAPTLNAYVGSLGLVHGTVQDGRLAEYRVTAIPGAGPAVDLARGTENKTDADLASLGPLGDGSYTLSVSAVDAAENQTVVTVPITVDSVAPLARIQSPGPGSVVRRTTSPAVVTGSATDSSLAEYVLSYGPGVNPSYFVDIARSTNGGLGIALGSWAVASLADGSYTLRLVATDRAGQTSEARVTVILDGTPPVSALNEPAEAAHVAVAADVVGTASDVNLESWTLEAAPGSAATAFQWSAIGNGTTSVTNGPLSVWDPLPPDGVHTLRLTARDRAGQSTSALRTVTVDTTPPAPPTGLRAEVVRTDVSTADVRLTWNQNSEADLAGYHVTRDEERLTSIPVPSPSFVDGGRPEGVDRYLVVAVDRAGNESRGTPLGVTVDVTPPVVAIARPLAGAAVAGTVEVRGTAFSGLDFKEYRLLVGEGTQPTTWALIKRSSIGVAGGVLGEWLAVGDGPRVLALEAEDLTGNQARTTVSVTVDTQPPTAPVLASVENVPAPTSLTASWQPSPEGDLGGYLVYRDGRIANAPGLVIGDLRAFLVPGPSYEDTGLPDGRRCYRIEAMDQAGNRSVPSNEICQTLDNRAPRAVLVEPADGTRFEFPIRLVASTPDTDVSSVQFERKAAGEVNWQPLGGPDVSSPFETTLDPASLTPGPYDVRAVATDEGARTDPAPASIRVVYGDATPPGTPEGLSARTDGHDVALDWTARPEPDLLGYRVYRDGDLLTATPIAGVVYSDSGRPLGRYQYRVTAVDQDGNEGIGAGADAFVYAVSLDEPYPVTAQTVGAVSGSGAQAETTVQVVREGTVIAEAPAPETGPFHVEGVPLLAGPNVLRAQGRDEAGSTSVPSGDIVLIANQPPAAPSGLAHAVSDHTVDLSWDAVADPELFGYAVRRDGTLLTASAAQTDINGTGASSYSGAVYAPENAVDGDPNTAWLPSDPGPAWWSVTFPSSVLVESVQVEFADFAGAPVLPAYRIEAAWEGRFLPLVQVAAGGALQAAHALPTPFATDTLRVVFDAPGDVGLAEVSVSRRGLVPLGTTTFQEAAVADGRHSYAVSAVDRYGAESALASVEVPVGDVEPPAKPIGLVASTAGSDVSLSWMANGEADLARYVVLRDGARISEVATPNFVDPGRPNGSYSYTVRAVDQMGNESVDSDPAVALVAVTSPPPPVLSATALGSGAIGLNWTHPGASAFAILRSTSAGGPYALLVGVGDIRAYPDDTAARGVPHYYVVRALDPAGNESLSSNEASATPVRTDPPVAPVILDPTDAAHSRELATTVTRVAGSAERGSVVTLDVNDVLAGTATAGPGVVRVGGWAMPEGAVAPVLSPDGRTLAYSVQDGGTRVRWLDLQTGTEQPVASPGDGDAFAAAFSPDGRQLAYRSSACSGCGFDLYVLDLDTGGSTPIETEAASTEAADWSPNGSRLAFTLADGQQASVRVRDMQSGNVSTLLAGGTAFLYPRWSRDGQKIAVVARSPQRLRDELTLVDVASGARTTLDEGVRAAAASWAPDGRLAYTSQTAAGRRLRIRETTGAVVDATSPSRPTFDGRFSPDGSWLSFGEDRNEGAATVARLVARHLADGIESDVAGEPGAAGQPLRVHDWLNDDRLAAAGASQLDTFGGFPGAFAVEQVRLRPGENRLVARAVDPSTGLVSSDSEVVRLTVPTGLFPDLAVAPTDLLSYPQIPLVGQSTTASVRVHSVGGVAANLIPVTLTVVDPAGATVAAQTAQVTTLGPGETAVVSLSWMPAVVGVHRLRADVDAGSLLVEADEGNNRAEALVSVIGTSDLVASLTSDRSSYSAHSMARVTVRLTNGGQTFQGTSRTTVETAAGVEVAMVEERPVTLAYGESVETVAVWDTGTTYAGDYRFRVRVLTSQGAIRTEASQAFVIVPDMAVFARLVATPGSVAAGAPAQFQARVENRGSNSPQAGLVARLLIAPAAGGAPVHQSDTPLPQLLPGAWWESVLAWPAAGPAGEYTAELRVLQGTSLLASATTPLVVTSGEATVTGQLVLDPGDVLSGGATQARVTLTNASSSALAAYPVAVEVVAGSTAAVLVRQVTTIDVPAGGSATTTLVLDTAALAPGLYPALLKAGPTFVTLDRRTFHVHGIVSAPSVDSPANGSRVATAHPALTVNNASSSEGASLTYEFALYGDAALTQALPGAVGVPEAVLRTSWRVAVNLEEDRTYYWRARATDGFSSSAWTAVSSFMVDETNRPPSAPVPDTPLPDAHVDSREPVLTVANAHDPEGDVLAYEFRVAADAEMTSVVASATGVPEGAGLTSWRVPVTLDDAATYFWTARARDAGQSSPWTAAISFVVDSVNSSPSAPTPVRPVAGVAVPTRTPELVVANAADPEGDPLTYRFEVDQVASFDSPALQASSPVAAGVAETTWTSGTLDDNTLYYWRAAANDGQTTGPWGATASFLVNLANDPPSAPVPLHPPDNGVVATSTPTLRVRNSTDADRDPLTYEFTVRDGTSGTTVASASGVASGNLETDWIVSPALAEDLRYDWQARAYDGTIASAWSTSSSFRVNAVPDPPTAPMLSAPAEGAVVAVVRPALVVVNATSPEGLALTYTFELYSVAGNGSLTLVDQASGVAEAATTTGWSPSVDLGDGNYSWRARAVDANQAGPWMPSAHFSVLIDRPPAPPSGLQAAAGDGQVTLTWTASSEPDVIGYRVYRSFSAGGPYAFRVAVAGSPFVDTGLTNGVTVYYVLTTVDSAFESVYSSEVSATPQAAANVLDAQVISTPAGVYAECLLSCAGSRPSSPATGGPTAADAFEGARPEAILAATGPVRPRLECILDNPDGTYTGVFGYQNDITSPYTQAVGVENGFTPAPQDRGQPTVFQPGRTAAYPPGVFRVAFSGSLTWRLLGRTVTASSSSPRCTLPTFQCLQWLYVNVELPAGYDPHTIVLNSIRLAGSVAPDPSYVAFQDVDGDGIAEKRVRFSITSLGPFLTVNQNNALSLTGSVGSTTFRGTVFFALAPPQVGLLLSQREITRSAPGGDVEARLTFRGCARGAIVDIASVRLNGSVPVKAVVSTAGSGLIVTFDRAAVLGVLPNGNQVQVSVTGLVGPVPFSALDFIRVVP